MDIVLQRPDAVEVPYVRFLLGDFAGEVVEDPERTEVRPRSLVVCHDLAALTPEYRTAVRDLRNVGLFHISQEWYQDPLDAYADFAYVWRNHHHPALAALPVRQLPLPPAALDVVTATPRPEALKPPAARTHTWSFAGQLKTTRKAMVGALRTVPGGFEHITGFHDVRTKPMLTPDEYLQMLAESVFVPCSMGNVHLESFRVEEALELGAVPIVERRWGLDYFRALLGDHPLPTVRRWSEAPALIERFLADPAALAELQTWVVAWWAEKKRQLSAQTRSDVRRCLVEHPPEPPLAEAKLPGVWRGRLEMLRHHNPAALRQRAIVTAQRLARHGSIRQSSAGEEYAHLDAD